jgi:hypothetical protein
LQGFGRGVIAGRDISQEEVIDSAPSLVVAHEVTNDMILNNYIYTSEDDSFGMITFGPSTLFNHKRIDEKDTEHAWASYDVPTVDQQLKSPNTLYTNVINKAVKHISAGDEIFTSYGDDTWFLDRGMKLYADNETASETTEHLLEHKYTIQELKMKNYPCLTNVFVNQSLLSNAGR